MSNKAYFERVAGDWDDMRPVFFSEFIRSQALEVAGVEVGRSAADVEAGTGFISEALVEAAWTFKRYDPGAGEFYNRILAKTGEAPKAICAVARKPAIIIWRLDLEQRPYRPA